ncbi:MAG: hypothetical protein K2I92_09940, partial [Muribaculaceae bacterium]|nr:hypothetical protein [Muribaculaceae bacterium]
MRTKILLTVLTLLILTSFGINAQRNTISTPEIFVAAGQETTLQVNLDNTSDIVAVQFTLSLPEGLTLSNEAKTTDRTSSHFISANEKVNDGYLSYTYIIMSPDNSIISGRTGAIMTVPLYADGLLKEGTVLHPVFSDVAIVTRDGSNIATGFSNGSVNIASSPDLVVNDVYAEESEISPGENLIINWKVENIGTVPTTGGWYEHISLINEDGSEERFLATTYYDDMIDAGGIVSRQAEIAVPMLIGIDGDAHIIVQLFPYSESGEPLAAQDNNSDTSEKTVFINKILQVEFSPQKTDEDNGGLIALYVSRSGNWNKSETFDLSLSEDSRVSLPATITIPENQSRNAVRFKIIDNEVMDSDSIVSVAVSGNGYPEATASLIIVDDDKAALTATLSNDDVTEGVSFRMTVSLGEKAEKPVKIYLTCEHPARFSFPKEAEIPEGEESITFDITAIDNNDIELDETIAFRVTADRHESAECLVTLYDNDMPSLIFSVSPENVSEADGYSALFAVIKRTDNLDKRVTLKLADDSNGLLSYPTNTIVLERNQAEAQFNIGVEDNQVVDGNKTVNITASVYVSSCGCSASGDTKGVLTATVNIIDDDGPTIKIKPQATSMPEGSKGNVFTISHNVNSDTDIKVRVSSDMDEILEYDHEVTVPAGSSSSTLIVDVKDNDISYDSAIATFKAEAEGYAMGSCWLMITDRTLPDAIVSLSSDTEEVEAGQTVGLTANVKNVGNTTLKSGIPVVISFSGNKSKIRLTTEKPIEAGDSIVMGHIFQLPAITGEHYFEATVNPDKNIEEILFINNSSDKVPVKLLSPFTATAIADKDFYNQGEEVNITGEVKGSFGS